MSVLGRAKSSSRFEASMGSWATLGPRLGHAWATTAAKRRETMRNEIHAKDQVRGTFWAFDQVTELARKPPEPVSQAGNASSNLVGATNAKSPLICGLFCVLYGSDLNRILGRGESALPIRGSCFATASYNQRKSLPLVGFFAFFGTAVPIRGSCSPTAS